MSASPISTAAEAGCEHLLQHYETVRGFSEKLCEPLQTEDFVVQTMPDVSPTKWHLAHVSWFFETFLLREYLDGYKPLNDLYNYLFNSYYNSVGMMHCRPARGMLTRPTVKEVFEYCAYVDEHIERLLADPPAKHLRDIAYRMEIGIHHEQQHQELLVTDIKHVFASNPLYPVYRERKGGSHGKEAPANNWIGQEGGIHEIGHEGLDFAYDNEGPRHRELLEDFQIGTRLITNGEFMEFMADGVYESPTLWLSAGWNTIKQEGWNAPFYWQEIDGKWHHATLSGLREVDPAEPVCHVSYFEADAFARWAGARLPSESEWEITCGREPIAGNFVEMENYHPMALEPGADTAKIRQAFGDVWEWTRSPYTPYPGYKAAEGALGEYNGKFMCGQYVLRGGSCATSLSHIRPTYRNFFYPADRWQFKGFRLAKDG